MKNHVIYIRCCELFTYDPRYKLCSKVKNGRKLQQEILNKKFDVENIHDTWAVCTSHITQIYMETMKRLLNIDIEVSHLNKNSTHIWAEFNLENRKMKADSCIKGCSDLTRVKMKLQTKEYHPIENSSEFQTELLAMNNKTRRYPSKDEVLLYKWNKIIEQLEQYKNTTLPINLHTCMSYLILHLLEREEQNKVNTVRLFQCTDKQDWFFLNLYTIKLQNGQLYYAQPRQNNQFNFYQTDRQNATHYLNHLQFEDKVQETEWKTNKVLVK